MGKIFTVERVRMCKIAAEPRYASAENSAKVIGFAEEPAGTYILAAKPGPDDRRP